MRVRVCCSATPDTCITIQCLAPIHRHTRRPSTVHKRGEREKEENYVEQLLRGCVSVYTILLIMCRLCIVCMRVATTTTTLTRCVYVCVNVCSSRNENILGYIIIMCVRIRIAVINIFVRFPSHSHLFATRFRSRPSIISHLN